MSTFRYVCDVYSFGVIPMKRNKNGSNHKKLGTISKNDLPNGRRGKHHSLLVDVVDGLQHLADSRAIRIPRADHPGSVADIRSAIHRGTKKRNIEVSTSSDEKYVYVWNQEENPKNE